MVMNDRRCGAGLADKPPARRANCGQLGPSDTHLPPIFPGPSDTHLPRQNRRSNSAPRGRSLSVRYLTRQDDVVLLSITLIVDTLSAANGRRYVRSLIDAHVRPAPDCRRGRKRHGRKRHALHSLPPMSSKAQPIAMLIFEDEQLDRPRRIFWYCVQYDAIVPQEISHGDRSSEIG
jgi:hypothetical protein